MTDVAKQVVELDELRIVVVFDNETDSLSSVDEGVPQIPETTTLFGRTPTLFQFEGHECKPLLENLCCAGHGFSAVVTGRAGNEEHTLLYDVGPRPDLWLENAANLGVELAGIEAMFLSHWHADHSFGFPQVAEAISRARREAGLAEPLVVSLHPDRPDRRGILVPGGGVRLLAAEPTFEAIAAAGATIEKHGRPHLLCNGFFYGSGEIERETAYEKGLVGHHTFHGEQGTPDPLILDERFLAARVKGRGTTVLSACSHAGVVNACLGAQKAFDRARIDLVLGGFHLAGKGMEQRIEATLRDLKERVRPRLLAPGHCTGWRAKAALATAFAPGRYAPSVVGSSYLLKAE